MKYGATFLVLWILSFTASAADISGDWSGTVATPKGDFPIRFSFKVEGGHLQGTMLGTDGTPFKVQDGKVEGSTVTFSVTLDYPGKSLLRTYKGVVTGDEIKFTVDSAGQISELVVKRVK